MSINIILSRLIFILLRLLNFTYRYRYHQNDFTGSPTNKNYILAIWHQNLLPGILAQTGNPHIVIISKSRDADPVAYACKKLGHMIVRGSSKRGDVDKEVKK